MIEVYVGILATGVFGMVGWAYHLGNKVAVVETLTAELEETLSEKFDAKFDTLTEDIRDVGNRCERIESILLNGYRKGKQAHAEN